MQIWQAAVLGVVQGLTEFLPISSTAHLLLVQEYWFEHTPEQIKNDPFTVVIQLGTLFAVFVYFHKEIAAILKAFISDFVQLYWITSQTPEGRLAKLLILGSIPAGLAGLFFKSRLREHLYSAVPIAIVTIIFALLLFAAERWAKRRPNVRGEESLTRRDVLFIGFFQALALMPGGSRSGCTITAGLFAGLTKDAAARFSFLLSIPIMSAAGLKDLLDWVKSPAAQANFQNDLTALAVGTAVSAVVGLFAIWGLLAWLRKFSMTAFVAYRILVGLAILLIAGKAFG